jgi:hypothetical protein
VRAVADEVNRLGRFDAVIHNPGIGYREPRRIKTEDGLPHIFAINVLASYILTALIERPDRLVYPRCQQGRSFRQAAFDSNSDTDSSTRSTGTFLCGNMARNQSGRLSGSM